MHKIEIIHIQGQDTVTLTNACSSCHSGCEPVNNSISETINEFNDRYSGAGKIERIELKEENLEAVADRLQELYNNSGESLIITASNVKFILGRMSPIVAIDDRLVASRYVPDADELKFAIDHNKGIYSPICN